MTLKPITFHLTMEDIDRYQKLIKQFPLTSEEKILNQIPKKLKAILRKKNSSFVLELIGNVELLYLAIVEGKPISEEIKRKILFALNYFIEEEDEIPDNLDMLGFLDDAVVVRWVVDEIMTENPEVFIKS
ncbi:MAG: DUF1232 domain-containing protein [Candidatus Marinimicrobia bacterium]|nr:DUF1232 domain-containing protein [Candidatus Neomarinimicrobiota bacterium]